MSVHYRGQLLCHLHLATSQENPILLHANNTGAGQPVSRSSLIRTWLLKRLNFSNCVVAILLTSTID